MRAKKPWVQALNIDPTNYLAWSTEVPRHENITFWCLDKGKLRASEYLAWAIEYYQLPAIRSEYFKQPANRSLWAKIQSVANWSPEMLPLEEWDGTIFVACVEPPEDIHWSFPVRYVLAQARDLKLHWDRLTTEATKNTGSIPVVIATPPPPKAKVSPEPVAPPKETVQKPIEAGFKLNLNVQTISTPESTSPVNVTPVASIDTPVGLNPELAPKVTLNLDHLNAPAGLHLAETTPAAPKPSPQTPAPPPTAPPVPAPQATAQPAPVSAPAPMAAAPPMPDSNPNQTGTGFTLVTTPQHTNASTASMVNGSIDSDKVAPKSLSMAQSESEVVAWVFQQLKQHFKYTWLLFIKSEKLVPYRWDATVTPSNALAIEPIDLSQPSLFRIVARTRMPYHGHVVESPINTSFFKNWGLRRTPPHVTAIPLMANGQLVSVLVCGGDKPAQMDQVLRFTEKLGINIVEGLGKKRAA